jgi:hypothetical protein
MTATLIKTPGFSPTQRVCFMGGEGIVKHCKCQTGMWIYVVEMPLGPEPDFGRAGAETMVIFTEEDLCSV